MIAQARTLPARKLSPLWTPQPNAAQCTVVAGAASIANDGVASCSITVTVKDSTGAAIAGCAVSVAVTGTGNTVTQPSVTDSTGTAKGSFVSTNAEVKTLSAKANGIAITQTGSCTVSATSDVTSIVSLSPTSGADSGGTGVTITVTGATGTPAVTFGGVSATSIVVVSSTTITCVTPTGSDGTVNVVVGSHTDTNAFTYVASSVPTPSGTILTDTRSGGAQDWTSQTTLANALSVSGTTVSSNGYPFGWTTGFEHSTNGRALVANYKSGIGALSIFWDLAGLSVSGIFAYQYKMWLGATAGGGGNGAVGDFDWGTGHKIAVIFFRDKSGGGSTNNSRHTHVWSTQDGSSGGNPAVKSFAVDNDQTVYAAGTCSGAGSATVLNDTTQAWTVNQWATGYQVRIWDGTGNSGTLFTITGNTATSLTCSGGGLPTMDATSKYRIIHSSTLVNFEDNHASTADWGVTGRGVATDLNALNGTVVTITTKITPETSPGSADGLLEMWCNTTKVFTGPSTARTGAPPLLWKELQLVGPTWNAGPARDFSGYFWDLVVWNPAS